MTVAAISVEARCTRSGKLTGGRYSLGFEIHSDDAWAVLAIDPGKRYGLAIVEIGDDELPVQQQEEVSSPELNPTDRSKLTGIGVSHSTPVDGGANLADAAPAPASDTSRPSKISPDKRLVQQAAMACTNPLFRVFLEKNYKNLVPQACHINNEEEAADVVRYLCAVKSRKQILPGTIAAANWNKLYSRFIAWKELPDLEIPDLPSEIMT